jgi:uncharacterized membrane protein HdeD (DUF308 family)
MNTGILEPASLRAHWWVPLARGLIAILFGVVLFLLPLPAVLTFVLVFGAFAFADGALAIVQAVRFAHPGRARWWWTIAQGVVGIAIGVATFVVPGITAQTLGLLIAAWAIATGVLEIGTAIRLRREIENEFFLIVAGIASLVLGLVLAAFPLGALIAVVYLVAAYAFVAGIALVALAFRLRSGKI